MSNLKAGTVFKHYADSLTYTIRILLKSAIRNSDLFHVTRNDIEKILIWENSAKKQVEIQFKPVVSSQVFTGVSAVVHLAWMRDAMSKLGSDPNKINPLAIVVGWSSLQGVSDIVGMI